MTKQKIYFYSFDKQLFEQMRGTIPGEVADLVWVQSEQQEWCAKQRHLTIVDGKRNDLRARLEELSHKKAYVVLLLNEDIAETQLEGDLGASLENGLVDDILLTPIRTVEVLSKMKHVAHLARVDDVNLANEQLKFVIGEMEADLLLARGIQKHLIPEKFKQVPGFQVNHKYLSGFKAGGDYLDFFEFEDSTYLGVLMSDSTGYGLSSSFMSLMFRLATRLTRDEIRSPSAILEKMFEEVRHGMKPKEGLSVFYGILNRKTFDFTFASIGNVRLYLGRDGKNTIEQKNRVNDPVRADSSGKINDAHLELRPGDRLVLMSDGFHGCYSDEASLTSSLTKHAQDPLALINEFTYRIKSKLESEDDLPEQDCSLLLVDVEKRAMRLAK